MLILSDNTKELLELKHYFKRAPAGVAAALSAKNAVQPRALNVKKLQSALLEMRCPIGTEQRLRELGLRK